MQREWKESEKKWCPCVIGTLDSNVGESILQQMLLMGSSVFCWCQKRSETFFYA